MYLRNENQLYYDFRISEDLDLNRNRVKTTLEIGKIKSILIIFK